MKDLKTNVRIQKGVILRQFYSGWNVHGFFLPSCQKQSREKKKDWKSKGIGNFLVQVVLAILKNWWEVRDFYLLQISEATRENSSSGKIY